MNPLSIVTDNIAELLVKIIEFTQIRQKILNRNVHGLKNPGFVPKDLPVQEFCDLLNCAVAEHIQRRRLLMRDTDNIRFGENGSMEVTPAVDEFAKALLQRNQDEYLELQIDKLLENSLNQKLAAELLRQKQGRIPIFEKLAIKKGKKGKIQLEDVSIE